MRAAFLASFKSRGTRLGSIYAYFATNIRNNWMYVFGRVRRYDAHLAVEVDAFQHRDGDTQIPFEFGDLI